MVPSFPKSFLIIDFLQHDFFLSQPCDLLRLLHWWINRYDTIDNIVAQLVYRVLEWQVGTRISTTIPLDRNPEERHEK